MNRDIFNIENFNIIHDDDNYYFFRALNKADSKDIEDGTIVDESGKINRIRTDRERYEGRPKYDKHSLISLEEVFDHIKMSYRKDTNCISLSSNTNVSAMYGRGFYNDTYAMIRVPKDELGKTVFHAGPYMMEEIQQEIEKYLSSEQIDEMTKYYIDSITHAKSDKSIEKIVKMYNEDSQNPEIFKKGIEYGAEKTKVVEYNALSREQNLDKNKLVAKLDIIGKRIIPHVSNKFLIQTIGNAFSSLELIHYNDIDGSQIIPLPKEVIDMFSIIQQLPTEVSESIKKDLLEKILNDDLNLSEFLYNDKKINTAQYSIEEMYNLTNGNIDYYDAINIRDRAFYLAKSKLRAKSAIENINKYLPKYKDIFEKEKVNLYGVEPEIFSRLSKYKMNASESVSLDLSTSEKKILNFINSLSDEELQNIVNNPIQTLTKLLKDQFKFEDAKLDKETYYAKAIVDMFEWEKLNISFISSEQKEDIITKLKESNVIEIYEKLKGQQIDEKNIPNLLLTNIIKNEEDIDSNDTFTIEELEDFLGYYEVKSAKLKLRSYQATAVTNINKAFQDKQYTAAVLPTGAGKSFVALSTMLQYKDKKILYLAPNNEILDQMEDNIIKYVHGTRNTIGKENISIIKEAFPNLELRTYSYLTDNHKDIRDTKYDLVVWDELHRTGAEEWGNNINKLLANQDENTKILSITATPQRDADGKDMAEEWAKHFGYTNEEIIRHKHLSINMELEEAIRLGYVTNPKIVNCAYSLGENNTLLDNLLEQLQQAPDSERKVKCLKKFDKLRKRVSEADGVDKVLQDNIQKGGKYIVFLPVYNEKGQLLEDENGYEVDSRLSCEETIKKYEQLLKVYLKESISEDELEIHSMLGSYSKSKNRKELKDFENNNFNKTQFMFVLNKLNEGKHVKDVNGLIWFRPLDENSKILYLQQLGRVIHSIDPNNQNEERPVVIDLVNNTLRVNLYKKNASEANDIDILIIIGQWILEHEGMIPNINSTDKIESNYGSKLKNIQEKYMKYIVNPVLLENLGNKKEEIEEIISYGANIGLWNIDFPEKIKNQNSKKEQEEFEPFEIIGILKDLYELQEEVKEICSINKLHEYRLVVEKKGRLIGKGKEDKELRFSDGTGMNYYWNNNRLIIKQLASEGNEDAIVIMNIANKKQINKLHEYRLAVEREGRLISQTNKNINLRFSDGTGMNYYWSNNRSTIERLASEGNEDAIVIMNIANKEQINKLHEYRLAVEKEDRLIGQGKEDKDIKFSNGEYMNQYWNNNRPTIKRLASEGNEDAIVIMNIANKKQINKLHEYRLAVEKEDRLIGQGKGDKKYKFSDNTGMSYYMKDHCNEIERLALEGDEDAIVIMNIANKQPINKLHEYRLAVEEKGRLIGYSKEDKELRFSDCTGMSSYWRHNQEKIKRLASEGDKDAIFILEIANRQQNNKRQKTIEIKNLKEGNQNIKNTNKLKKKS